MSEIIKGSMTMIMLLTAGCKIIRSSIWLFCKSIIEFLEGFYTTIVPLALELLKEKVTAVLSC
jgi:hypothetical protein